MTSSEPSRITFRFGTFEFDPSTGELQKSGIKIKLQGQPVEILGLLLTRPATLVTREELQQRLWPADTFVDFESSLNAAVKRLRAALSDSPEQPRFVETLARRGYRFIAPVEVVKAPDAKPSSNGTAENNPETAPSRVSKSAQAQVHPPIRSMGLKRLSAVLVAVIVVLSILFVLVRRRAASTKGPAAVPIHSLAVLPLANLSGDPQQEYFADGMTEELTTQLGKISALRVVSRTSAAAYTQKRTPVPELARLLHVDTIVEGAVLRSGNRVRITVQLIEASTDRHLWAQDYDGDMRDVLSLQSRVAQAIAGEIQAKLTPEEQARFAIAHPMDPQAYDDYLRGLYYWYESAHHDAVRITVRTREDKDLEKSGAYFAQAVEKDPASALPYAGLTLYYGASTVHGLIPPREGWPKAAAAARKALELDSSLAEAHHAVGAAKLFYDWDFAGAELEFRRAIALNPSFPETHRLYAFLLAILVRPDESFSQAEIAEELDPVTFQGTKATDFLDLRQFDRAITEFKEILRLNASSTEFHYGLATAYLAKGMEKNAMEETRRALLLSGDEKGAETITKAYEKAGYPGVIELRLGQLREKHKNSYVSSLDFAELYAELGNKDEAFSWLDRAYQERASLLCELGINSAYDRIRNDHRFSELLQKIGLPH